MRRASRAVAVTGVLALLGIAGTAGSSGASAAPSGRGSGLAAGGSPSSLGAFAVPSFSSLVTSLGVNPFAALPSNYSSSADSSSLYNLARVTGARSLWQRGVTGQGVSVGLIDSGISAVPGLTVTPGVDLTSTAETSASKTDGFGHGTAMAGIIAGRDPGDLTGSSAFDGVAPGASLVDIKVAEADGWSDPSRVIAGIAWVIQHKNDPGRAPIRVLNLSYGTDSGQGYGADPVAYAVEQAWRAGIVVVAAAGNDGSSDGRLLDPAIDPYVIAVGASTTGDPLGSVASFSNHGDGVRDPDVVAPGVGVQTLRAPGSVVDKMVPATGSRSRFIKGSGTSESTAVISGMAALLLSDRPELTPDQVKSSLTSTALPLLGAGERAQGRGLVQLSAASSMPPSADAQTFPASLGNGTLDASRGSGSWVAAGATPAEAENPALMGGPTGQTWAGRAWSGRAWSGSSWAADGNAGDLRGRAWSGRAWS